MATRNWEKVAQQQFEEMEKAAQADWSDLRAKLARRG